MPNYVLYARRSSDAEDRQVLSIASQLHELRLLANRQGLPVGQVFEESASARTPGRPVFASLLEQVLKGKVVGVLCWKLDRLARNPVDGGAIIWALDVGKLARIVTPERTFENTPGDKFWLQLEFGIAKKYSDDLSENVKRGNRAKLEQGWVPGVAPLGYLNDRLSKTIIPDPDRFPLIRRLWELVLNGTSPRFALQTLNNEWGFRTRTMTRVGGKPLAPSGLYRLLRDRFYYGLIDRGGWLYRGAHLPMITKEEFETVQSLLNRRHRTLTRRFFPYGQLLSCGSCGAAITAELHTKPSGIRYTYYRCTRRRTGQLCRERPIPGHRLDAQIRERVRSLEVDPTDLPKILERLVGPRPNPRFLQVRERTRERTRDDLLRQRARLIDLHLQGLIELDEYELRRSQLTASLDALGAQVEADPSSYLSMQHFRNRPFGQALLVVLATSEPEAKKSLLRKLGTWTLHDQQVRLEPMLLRSRTMWLENCRWPTRPLSNVPLSPDAVSRRLIHFEHPEVIEPDLSFSVAETKMELAILRILGDLDDVAMRLGSVSSRNIIATLAFRVVLFENSDVPISVWVDDIRCFPIRRVAAPKLEEELPSPHPGFLCRSVLPHDSACPNARHHHDLLPAKIPGLGVVAGSRNPFALPLLNPLRLVVRMLRIWNQSLLANAILALVEEIWKLPVEINAPDQTGGGPASEVQRNITVRHCVVPERLPRRLKYRHLRGGRQRSFPTLLKSSVGPIRAEVHGSADNRGRR